MIFPRCTTINRTCKTGLNITNAIPITEAVLHLSGDDIAPFLWNDEALGTPQVIEGFSKICVFPKPSRDWPFKLGHCIQGGWCPTIGE